MKPNNFMLIVFVFLSFPVFGQRVTQIKPKLMGDKLVVEYTIAGAKFYQEFNVYLYVSRDQGNYYEGPLMEVSGDVGKGISSGSHSITWEVMKELPFSNEELVFDVRVQPIEKKVKKSLFLQYVGNLTTPLGLRIGLLGKTGFFVEGRVSPDYNKQSSYTYTGDLINSFNHSGYYQFSDKTAKPALSALGGITIQPSWNTFLYVGAGYGTQQFLVEIVEYEYSTGSKATTSYAESTTSSYSGVEVEAGAILKFGHLLVSGGATALNFEVFNFTAGIGIVF